MEKVFTLEELQFIKDKYVNIYTDTYYLCVVRTFEKKWNHSWIYIKKLAEKFLSETFKWKDYHGGKLLFCKKGIIENIDNWEKDTDNLRQIRIDFLDWLIKNIEQ